MALHKALMTLMAKVEYEAISVSDIVAEANVGRSTFYSHFADKDDLLRRAPDKLRERLVEHQQATLPHADDGIWPLGFSRFMFDHLRERQHLRRRTPYKGKAGAITLEMLRQLLADLLRGDLARLDHADRNGVVPREFAVQYLVGAFLSVLVWWLDRGAKESPEAMDEAFRTLAQNGLGRFPS